MTLYRIRWTFVWSAVIGTLLALYYAVLAYSGGLPASTGIYAQLGLSRWADVFVIPLALSPLIWLLCGDAPSGGPHDIADMGVGCFMMIMTIPVAMLVVAFALVVIVEFRELLLDLWRKRGFLPFAYLPWVAAIPFVVVSIRRAQRARASDARMHDEREATQQRMREAAEVRRRYRESLGRRRAPK